MRKTLLFAAVLLAITALSGRAQASGHIYLLRGLAGIFSTGLDVLDEKLVQRGYNAAVHSYDFYNSLAEEAARLQKSGKGPIIIMGSRCRHLHGRKNEDFGRIRRPRGHVRPDDDSGGAVKCGPSRELLHGQHSCIKGTWLQRFHYQHQSQFGR